LFCPAGNSRGLWLARRYAHLFHHSLNRIEGALHLLGVQPTDAAHSKTFSHGEFTRLNHITPSAQPIVKTLKIKIRVCGHFEGHDNGCLELIWQQGFES